MSIWSKIFNKITFKDYPDTTTPLSATNLNTMTDAIDGLDDRVVELNSNLTKHNHDNLYFRKENINNYMLLQDTTKGEYAEFASGTTNEVMRVGNMAKATLKFTLVNDLLAEWHFYTLPFNSISQYQYFNIYSDNGDIYLGYIISNTPYLRTLLSLPAGTYYVDATLFTPNHIT